MAQHEILALGWLSQELSSRAGGPYSLPDWFPQGPEWLELWDRAWDATVEDHGVSNDLAEDLVEQDGDSLQEDIRSALNRHSAENASNTSDFILTNFLLTTLEAFNEAVTARDEWYGIQPSPGGADDQVMWLANDANPVDPGPHEPLTLDNVSQPLVETLRSLIDEYGRAGVQNTLALIRQ